MTRPTPFTQTVSGQTKRCADARAVSPPASKFLSFEENNGAFHWALVAAGDDRLVQSATSASYEQAKQAAGVVRSGAVSAPFENRADDPARLELAAHAETATAAYDLDAERWLDEGGSFSSEADHMASTTLIAPAERHARSATPHPRRTYTCPECGHVLRVSGLGRHRVFFELTDERAEDPVMNRVCPVCAHGLPGKNRR
jgi:hypothetical protein